jgi:hypothetical protein
MPPSFPLLSGLVINRNSDYKGPELPFNENTSQGYKAPIHIPVLNELEFPAIISFSITYTLIRRTYYGPKTTARSNEL